MYQNNQLGDLGLQAGITGQIESFAASSAAKLVTTSMISTFAPAAFGSYAGPIGTLVGGLVSLFMSLFGPPPKKPAYGLTVVVPQGQKPTVKLIMAYLQKSFFNILEGNLQGTGSGNIALHQQIAEHLIQELQSPPANGALVIEAGGLETAVDQVKKMNYSQVTAYTRNLVAPYVELLSHVTDPQIKSDIENTVLPYTQSPDSKYNLDVHLKQYATKNPGAAALINAYDEYKITGGQDLQKSVERGFTDIMKNLNQIFIAKTGFDTQAKAVVNQDLASKAFAGAGAGAGAGTILAGNTLIPLLLFGGLILLSSRQG